MVCIPLIIHYFLVFATLGPTIYIKYKSDKDNDNKTNILDYFKLIFISGIWHSISGLLYVILCKYKYKKTAWVLIFIQLFMYAFLIYMGVKFSSYIENEINESK